METALSKNGVLIRLPDERWVHLTEGHSEMAGRYSDVLETIESPDAVYSGNSGELLAVKEIQTDKYIVVVYKKISVKDGSVITAFQSSRKRSLRGEPKYGSGRNR
ncbi:MAG: hypothetical protein PHQ34_06360 [Methanothrix sp.]|nr:hypothetical protein [Methanothrix sp.]